MRNTQSPKCQRKIGILNLPMCVKITALTCLLEVIFPFFFGTVAMALEDGLPRGMRNEILIQMIQLGQKSHQFIHILVSISILPDIFLPALFYIFL